ncbi:MAG: hypothetical protein J6L98_01285, partial [Bacteroidales bacterium]|nr:hypothetical protein [Bacteroidales bacterium]
RIWWSESVMGVRWSLGGSARIRYINVSDPSKVYDLTTAGRYYNPAPSPDGTKVSATEYPYSGGSRLAVLSTKDGSIEKTMEVPDSLQITESAWVNDRIFVAGLSDHGMGVYELSDGGRVDVVLGPQPVELSDLKPAGPGLGFICDRTGTREMYLLDIQSGSLLQATSTRYGVSSPVFNNAADTLYYSSLAPSDNPEAYRQGWMIYSTPAKDLPMLPVSFDDIHSYKVADTMSAQEKELAGDSWEWAREYSKASFSEPRRHRKLTPTFHSWAPIYFDYDDVEGISLDEYYKTSSPGATAIFQNLVGDGYGSIGYGFHQDADLEDLWRHSAHLRFTYNGLPPVIEFSADIGDRAATDIVRVQQTNLKDNTVSIRNSGIRVSTRPYFNGSLRLYTPLNFSSGGVSRGLIPQLKYSLSNDRLNDKIILGISSGEDGDKKIKEVGSIGNERISYLSTVDLSVRGYVMRSQAPSQPYPRLGIGAEIGLRSRPGHSGFYSNMAYLYTYGYLPGLRPDQGLRLTATIGAKVGGGEFSYTDSPASFVPRGFADSNVRSILNRCSPMRYKLSADYVIRFLNIDWSGLSPLAYIKNFSLTPFADFAQMRFNTSDEFLINPENISSERLLSVGADLTVNLGNFFWLPFDSQVGIRYARNSWKNIEGLKVNGLDKDHFSFIFNVSL